jgi:hypothetical protein
MRHLLVALALVATGCGAPAVDSMPTTSTPIVGPPGETILPADTTSSSPTVGPTTPPAECSHPILFEYPPVDLGRIEYVVPLGLMFDSHVTPVDHQYFQNFKEPERWFDVYSPGPGRVIHLQHMNQTVADGPATPVDDYRLVIEHTCGISSIFIHIGRLSPSLAAVAPGPGEHASVDVAVEGGETVGASQRNVDFSIVDLNYTTDRLLETETYRAEPWKPHTPDPFGYFTDRLRQQMEDLSLRSAQPRGGAFAYDIDGRLVGNWFQQGTNGYAGLGPPRYWATHLSVAYDHLDPDHVVISLGDFAGTSRQFGVVGNAPNPAEITTGSGLVVYELVGFDYWVGDDRWDRVGHARDIDARNSDTIEGVVLFQLVEDRILKVEAFPGLTAAQVVEFTGAALLYER